jgi:hypothetical protein
LASKALTICLATSHTRACDRFRQGLMPGAIAPNPSPGAELSHMSGTGINVPLCIRVSKQDRVKLQRPDSWQNCHHSLALLVARRVRDDVNRVRRYAKAGYADVYGTRPGHTVTLRKPFIPCQLMPVMERLNRARSGGDWEKLKYTPQGCGVGKGGSTASRGSSQRM